MTPQPSPGSPDATRAGCTCPVIDNHYGRGIGGDGQTYWINGDCPLHGFAAGEDDGDEDEDAK